MQKIQLTEDRPRPHRFKVAAAIIDIHRDTAMANKYTQSVTTSQCGSQFILPVKLFKKIQSHIPVIRKFISGRIQV